jgi:uncharacterized protein YbjT (DUF2867 family)
VALRVGHDRTLLGLNEINELCPQSICSFVVLLNGSKSNHIHEKSIMKILITTPAGSIGRSIIPELLAPEFSVRVITRNPSRLPSEIRNQVEVIRGSTDDTNALCEALDAVDALFWCIPRESVKETNVRSYYERFACAASLAVREAKTPRVVAISGGLDSAMRATEDILNESGAAIRHLRCGWLRENLFQRGNPISGPGLISYPMAADAAIPMGAVTGIADIALKLLVRTDWSGVASLDVGRPEEECPQAFETLLT